MLNLKISDETFYSNDFESFFERIKKIKTAKNITIKKGDVLTRKKNEVYFILNGFLLIEETDNIAIVGHAFKYMPVGILEIFYPNINFKYTAESLVRLLKINKNELDLFIIKSKNDLILYQKMIFHITASVVHLHYERNDVNTYKQVRNMIYRYHYMKSKDRINNEGLASFIVRRTTASRSYIFQVLSDLKSGGFIDMKNGKLIKINKNIPMGY